MSVVAIIVIVMVFSGVFGGRHRYRYTRENKAQLDDLTSRLLEREEDLDMLHSRVAELENRLDFAERLLAERSSAATPTEGERV